MQKVEVGMKFKIKSDENKKINLNWIAINAYLSRWKPNTEFEVEIVRRQKTVSDPMRKYYFSAVLPVFMNAYGYEPEEDMMVHRHIKCVFFRVKPDKHGIYREIDIPSVFSNESTVPIPDKVRFIEWVIRKAAEEGGYVEEDMERTMV
jgi:hypothetical protein